MSVCKNEDDGILFTSFKLNKSLWGLNILAVREITSDIVLTKVFKLDEYIIGLLNLRGQIITVFDLGIKMGLPKSEITKKSRIIVLQTKNDINNDIAVKYNLQLVTDQVALLVDSVHDVVNVPYDEIEPIPPGLDEYKREFVSGIYKNKKDLLILLNIEAVLK